MPNLNFSTRYQQFLKAKLNNATFHNLLLLYGLRVSCNVGVAAEVLALPTLRLSCAHKNFARVTLLLLLLSCVQYNATPHTHLPFKQCKTQLEYANNTYKYLHVCSRVN